MAIVHEDMCVGPCPQGCLGSSCPNKNAIFFTCDECGEDFNPEELYEYDGDMLCSKCLLDKFPTVATKTW